MNRKVQKEAYIVGGEKLLPLARYLATIRTFQTVSIWKRNHNPSFRILIITCMKVRVSKIKSSARNVDGMLGKSPAKDEG